MPNRLKLEFSISFYIGAVIRNKKGEESSNKLTICMSFFLIYVLYCSILQALRSFVNDRNPKEILKI